MFMGKVNGFALRDFSPLASLPNKKEGRRCTGPVEIRGGRRSTPRHLTRIPEFLEAAAKFNRSRPTKIPAGVRSDCRPRFRNLRHAGQLSGRVVQVGSRRPPARRARSKDGAEIIAELFPRAAQ